MEFKNFQQTVLDIFDAYLDELARQRAKADKIRAANALESDPDLIRPVPDYPTLTWEALRGKLIQSTANYTPHQDGVGGPVPNVCLKVPTGGGKTLLATAAVSRVMGKYLSANTGFVLWIVPNEAIYSQTRKQLTDRDHPYRQMLDRAAAGRVKFFEKDDRIDRRDVDNHLCVMLLMLQSANRQTKETLRLFRDRGNIQGFFPSSDDFPAHFALLRAIPNLSAYGQDRSILGSIVHDSLGNVLRLIRPVIVMDEGHKAYSEIALNTLYGFNPCLLLELSATPDRAANLLVNVHGKDLANEEMIKLPINVKVKSGDDWRDCLRESLATLDHLQQSAEILRANSERYVRPIMLVQVERTGKEQREVGLIHAEDAKEFLLKAGLSEREIAIKTSEVNDLNAPENQDLLSPTNVVRVIITKQALQEGWDCPFAYILCALSASQNMRATTQIVGRILRQPDTIKTGIQELDECYVICHHAKTAEVVAAIKSGLEADGMADLTSMVRDAGKDKDAAPTTRKVKRRPVFGREKIFLPVVNWVEKGSSRPLAYDQDILFGLDWEQVKVAKCANDVPLDGSHSVTSQTTQLTLTDGAGGEFFQLSPTRRLQEISNFDPVYVTRAISHIVPNPWIGRAFVEDFLRRLKVRGITEAKLGAMSGYLVEHLAAYLLAQRDSLAEDFFIASVAEKRIQFRLLVDHGNWRMAREIETDRPISAAQFVRTDGMAVQKSLFTPIYRDDFNSEEAGFACYLDEQKALRWWHRNVALSGNYYLQGWKKNKVYPDFIFAKVYKDGRAQLVVLEMKGDQLEGNLDTVYKRKLLLLLSKIFKRESSQNAGQVKIKMEDDTLVFCDLILMSEWKTRVPNEYFTP